MKAPVYHGPGRRSGEEVPDADRLVLHRFGLSETDGTCDVFAHPAGRAAWQVVLLS